MSETPATPAQPPPPPTRRPLSRWARLTLSGAIAAAAAALIWLETPPGPSPRPPPGPQSFETARGQVRTLALEDGTRITLNAASRISVTFDRGSRRIVMGDAEAAFDVAKDERPFFVTVGADTVRVVGTEFDIAHRANALTITVRRGVVEVAGRAGATVKLVRGDQLIQAAGSSVYAVRTVIPDRAFAWKTGG